MKLDLGRAAISSDMRNFASIFPTLQDNRHAADYDPNVTFQSHRVIALIDLAEAAIAAFDRADPAEQADILALMMIRSRR